MERQRFKDLEWFEPLQNKKVLIIGAGGIGSWTALFLKRAGLDVTVVDYDTIESHNLGGQFFKESQIGFKKVEALKENLKEFTGEDIKTIDDTFFSPLFNADEYDIVISAVDNMGARENIFNFFKDSNIELFVDGRLEAEDFHIYTVTRDEEKLKKYKNSLFKDESGNAPSCSAKQTSHIASIIGAMITNIVTQFYSSITKPSFYTEYIGSLNLLNSDD